jgi:cyclic pyranopterin phosphate synthase
MAENNIQSDLFGKAKMVNVSHKPISDRIAIASGKILMKDTTLEMVKANALAKGDVLGTAKVAGIMAAKNTSNIIPMSHMIPLSGCEIDFEYLPYGILVVATVQAQAKTGVELEALIAVNAALMTIYDMAKSSDKEMVITDIKLLEKYGGKSGHFVRKENI